MDLIHEFTMHDGYNTDRRTLLRYSMDAAKRQAEMMFQIVRAVSIVDSWPGVDDKGEPFMAYKVRVWGYELEVPEEYKHWTERLADKVNALISGVWGEE